MQKKKNGGFVKTMIRHLWPPKEEIVLTGSAAQAAKILDLSQKELQRLMMLFKEVDIDESGEMDYDEFFEFIDEPRSPFADALFKLIDLDGSGTIDFNEFIQVLTTYCMYSRDDILRFCFDTFDKDGSGAIDEKEFMDMCYEINNANPAFPDNFKRALEQFDRNDDGLIDFDEFRELNRRYPLVLFPAFRMQDRMQKSTLGEYKWAAIAKKRERERYIEEYKRTHDGALPPDPFCKRVYKKIFRPGAKYLEEDEEDAVGDGNESIGDASSDFGDFDE